MREAIAAANRVVVKVGSSSLTTAAGGIDLDRIRALVDILAGTRLAGRAGPRVLRGDRGRSGAACPASEAPGSGDQQAAASVGQGLLMGHYTRLFGHHGLGVGQVLLTVDDVTRRGHYRNAYRTFGRLLELGVVPVVNENDTVATHEIRFGDNDRLAALVAHLVHAGLDLAQRCGCALHRAPDEANGPQDHRRAERRRSGASTSRAGVPRSAPVA